MPDDIDRAQERDLQYQADMEIDRQYRAAHQPALAATGDCLYCGEPLAPGARFCDSVCRDAWQHERDLKLMRGVK
jgi:hypothetical protein